MATKTATFIQVRPGVLVEKDLATPEARSGEPRVTKWTVNHYAQLVGRKIVEVRFESFEGYQELPVLVLDNGSSACVLCDPEGNGPGHLEINT